MSLSDDYQVEGQLSIFDLFNQDIWSGRTSQEHSAQTKEKTLDASLKKQQKSSVKAPLFLDLRGGGHLQVASWERGGPLLGEYMMHSFGESPKEENVSLLSQILEEHPHPKYSLSEKACLGILRRAETRGKKLPELLEITLKKQAGLLPSKNEQDACPRSEINQFSNSSGEDIAGTLDSNYYKGCGERQGVEREVVCQEIDNKRSPNKCLNSWDVQSKHIQSEEGIAESLYSGEYRYGGGESYVMQKCYGVCSYHSNSMLSDNPNSGFYEADTTRTLDNNGGNPCCNQDSIIVLEGNGSRPSYQCDGDSESDIMNTLNGTEHHAVCVGNGQLAQLRITDKVGALNCMHDQQAIMVTEPSKDTDSNMHNLTTYGLDRASFNQGRNALYDFAVEEEKAQPIVARGPGGVLTTQSEPCAQEITKG